MPPSSSPYPIRPNIEFSKWRPRFQQCGGHDDLIQGDFATASPGDDRCGRISRAFIFGVAVAETIGNEIVSAEAINELVSWLRC